MLSPSEALGLVLARVPEPKRVENVPLAEARGRCLAAPAVSDVDLPPFEKSMMDGFACAHASLAGGAPLRVAGESRAGAPFGLVLGAGECVEIFTGAELPRGSNTVEMIENVRREGLEVYFERPVRPGQHVSHRGEILRVDQVVYGPQKRLSAADLSVLASIGVDPVPVYARPRISVLTTGDELVAPREKPGRGEIREGNTFFLAAACQALGCSVVRVGIVPDDRLQLGLAFGAALEDSEVLITTGGVSVGKYDLVGQAFEALGVEPILHKVAIKPGKPIWFGMRAATSVFGLPGNPVSALLGFELFVRPALVRLCGDDPALEGERILRGRWLGKSEKGGDRQNNLPALVRQAADGVSELEPLPFRGSADILSAARAAALVIVPPGDEIRPGELVSYRPL